MGTGIILVLVKQLCNGLDVQPKLILSEHFVDIVYVVGKGSRWSVAVEDIVAITI